MKRLRLELELVLPGAPHTQDACVARLRELLRAKVGVEDSHAVEPAEGQPGQLCIHYDPAVLSVAEVRALVRRSGVALSRRYAHVRAQLRPMHARRARSLESRLRRVPGVLEASVSPDGAAEVELDRTVGEESALERELSRISAAAPHEEGHEEAGVGVELAAAGAAGALLLAGWLAAQVLTVARGWSLAAYLAAYALAGAFTARDVVASLRARRLEIDLLMLAAALGAAALGAWAEGALLLVLFNAGHALEHYAMGRARRAITALAELAPETALVRREGGEEEVPVEELRLGDVALVKPGERVPADGFVLAGESAVDQSPITGESIPALKRPVADPRRAAAAPLSLEAAHRVFAGAINGEGALEVQVTARAEESTLARVVEMVNEAEAGKSPTQKLTERFERRFVPAVLMLVSALLLAFLVVDEPFSASFYRAMAVLVAASPCALAIATPSAVLSGVARAARGGVLIKGGRALEALGRASAFAFDKTGTLTAGRPRLTDLVPASDVSEAELLRTAAAVERLSHHPLAAAVVRAAVERAGEEELPAATGMESLTGRGLRATVEGEAVLLGKLELFDASQGPPPPERLVAGVRRLEADGRTTVVVRRGTRYLGVLGLMDTPRPAARPTLEALRALGARRLILLSGDNQRVAEAMGRALGIDDARGGLLPEDKVVAVRRLSAGGGVAMVGDGVNDAPAMAAATVSIAMGAAGSDVALETADVALMSEDLAQIPFAVGLSRRASAVIRQNLVLSLGVVALLIPATILGLGIGPAVALHEGSTLVVVMNALSLLAYRERSR